MSVQELVDKLKEMNPNHKVRVYNTYAMEELLVLEIDKVYMDEPTDDIVWIDIRGTD